MVRRSAVLVRSALVLLVLAVGAALVSVPVALAAESGSGPQEFTIAHGPVTTTLTTPGSDGHQLGDVRVVSIETADESGAPARIDATLITTAIDVPEPWRRGPDQRARVRVW